MWLALLLLWLYAKRVEKKSLLLWSKRKRKILFSILAIFAILLVIFLGIFLGNMLISKILSYFPTSTNITSPKLLEYGTLFRHNIPLLIFTAATAAIVEELVFRGYIQPRIEVIFKNPIWGIIGSALLFALLHLSYDSWLQIIGPLFIGLVLSIFYWKYRNIKILIICHFVIDLIGLFSLINVHWFSIDWMKSLWINNYAEQKYCCKEGLTLKQSAAVRYQQQFRQTDFFSTFVRNLNFK